MIAKNLASRITVCLLAMLLVPATANPQTNTTTTTATKTSSTPDDGSLAAIELKASKLKAVTVSQIPATPITGTTQCPGIGTPAFTVNYTIEYFPINDDTQYFDTVHTAPVLDITHERDTVTETYNGNTLVIRQDWTRIKENDNGIDDMTGIRHYIGNFLEETQTPNGGSPTVTAESQGVMTLREPLGFSTGPLAGVANRVDVVQFIGPQAGWLEPFQVTDARQCQFLASGTVQPINSFYTDHCVVNGKQTITYNGVSFTGNIVGCKQSTWP